ncbi:hypothetical protein FV218_17455 [Methylobacterium sp. WL69]|uniref:hypothetical protein n=1 Tax=Methylobacterium sp. WL69 TaxID=2603893 RepID=UPI0011CC2466|nr:hypothetical protein [Methylobacterium sp. WL69]TXM69208.1 hypothetical protein FV218_17455 [Methylobacterium sp. WL69]
MSGALPCAIDFGGAGIMTDEKRRAAIKALIVKRTAANTASPAAARAALIEEGIYTKDGELRATFGGPDEKATRAA